MHGAGSRSHRAHCYNRQGHIVAGAAVVCADGGSAR